MSKRFNITEGKVADLYSKRLFELVRMDRDYMAVKYKAGFIQPAEYDEETHSVILEQYEKKYLHMEETDEETLLNKMLPLFIALKEMQSLGYVYGNLSPECIIDTNKGYFLADFGIGEEQLDKNDYSAYEYYIFHGKGNKSSDVYSICAIVYELLTGIHLKNALKRVDDTDYEPLIAFGVSEKTANAIEKGLNVFDGDRFEDIETLMDAIYTEKQIADYQNDWDIEIRKVKVEDEDIEEKIHKQNTVKELSDQEEQTEKQEKKYSCNNKNIKYIIGICVILAIAATVFIFAPKSNTKIKKVKTVKKDTVIEATAMPVGDISADYSNSKENAGEEFDNFVGQPITAAESRAEELDYKVTKTEEYSDTVKIGMVIKQIVDSKKKMVSFVVSKGGGKETPTIMPTVTPTTMPTATVAPTITPTVKPTKTPTPKPTKKPVKKKKHKKSTIISNSKPIQKVTVTKRPKVTKKPLKIKDDDFTIK